MEIMNNCDHYDYDEDDSQMILSSTQSNKYCCYLLKSKYDHKLSQIYIIITRLISL